MDIAKLRELLRFLAGEAPLDGVWFEEPHPTKPYEFWWREELRNNAEALLARLESAERVVEAARLAAESLIDCDNGYDRLRGYDLQDALAAHDKDSR